MIADALKVGAKGYMKKPLSEAEIERRIIRQYIEE